MTRVTPQEVKDHLDELLAEAAKGEEVVITGMDGSLFKLTLTKAPAKGKRELIGSAKGWFKMADDFDEPLEDFREYME